MILWPRSIYNRVMRTCSRLRARGATTVLTIALAVNAFVVLTGCGYLTVGAPAHLSASTGTLAIPVFATHTQSFRAETVMTNAVIREFALRTHYRVTPDDSKDPDTVLHGTIQSLLVTPLTYNSQTQQSSSFLVTVVVSARLMDRNHRVLYENKNYVFRQQYQSTMDLPTFLEENPAAVERLSRDFARALVADVMESY